MTCECGERMWISTAETIIFDIVDLELLERLKLMTRGAAEVWFCFECYGWQPVRLTAAGRTLKP